MVDILYVEDEPNLGMTLRDQLIQGGFTVTWAKNMEEALSALQQKINYDVALLDVALPSGSGFDIAKILKKSSPNTSVLFLSAYGNPEMRIQGLELGAEDYVVKPFHLKELRLRILNSIKRKPQRSDNFQINGKKIDLKAYRIYDDKNEIPLSSKERDLLGLLLEKRGIVVSREEILEKIWKSTEDAPTSRTIDNFILRLRKILEKDPNCPTLIRSVRGVGYIFSNE